jgi:hypothetical protein
MIAWQDLDSSLLAMLAVRRNTPLPDVHNSATLNAMKRMDAI